MPRRYLKSDGTGGRDADAVRPPAASDSWWWSRQGPAVKLAIAGNAAVVVLFFAAIVWRLFFADRVGQEAGAAAVSPEGADAGSGSASSGASTPCASPRRAVGPGKEDLLALPVFVVQGLSASDEEGAGEGRKVECAVCISELRDGDTGRLLPRCGHRFHAACVDRWFRSQVTCPLCRATVTDGGPGQNDSKVAPIV